MRVTVPNASNLNKRDFEKWPYAGNKMHILTPFEHLHGFSGKSLDKLFESEGLVIFLRKSMLLHHPRVFIANALALLGLKSTSTSRLYRKKRDKASN